MLMSSADSAPLLRALSEFSRIHRETCELAFIRRPFAKIYLKSLVLTSSVGEAGSRMIRVNIDAFR